jgi:hypothetical protein
LEVAVEPYAIAAEAIDLEVYVLAALVSGSAALAGLEGGRPGLRWARSTFEASEVSRRLIGLAIMLRSQLDASSRPADAVVGSLVPDVSAPSLERPLGLREACNKIIHAESVDLAPEKWKQSERPPISSTITLQGTHRDQEWLAHLDVLSFLDAVSTERP